MFVTHTAVAMLAVACTPPATHINLFGFNWSPRLASYHPKSSEQVRLHAKHGTLFNPVSIGAEAPLLARPKPDAVMPAAR